MKIEHKEIKKSATEATRLIENYWADYNKISDELKPEIISRRRADLANEFSKAVVEHISRLKAGIDQLEQERAQMTDPERRLILDALREAPTMSAGEVHLAQSFGWPRISKTSTNVEFFVSANKRFLYVGLYVGSIKKAPVST